MCIECAHHWKDDVLLAPVVGLPRFSEDTKRIFFPVTCYRELLNKTENQDFTTSLSMALPESFLKFQQEIWLYVFDVVQEESHDMKPVCVLNVVRNTKDAMAFTNGVFSFSSKGLLVGLTSRAKHAIKIWPDFENAPNTLYTCNGTLGCWSPADEYILTWFVDLKSSCMERPPRSCSLWRRNCLSKGSAGEPQKSSIKHNKELWFTEDGDMFWGQFLPNLHNRLGIATCVVNENVTLLLWDAGEGRVMHRLHTGISYDQTQLIQVQAWDKEWIDTQHSYGLHPISVSGDGKWIGVYSSGAKKGTIWDASSGIEILKFSSPDSAMGRESSTEMGMDMLLSRTGNRFLLCSEDEIVLWVTPSLCSFSSEAGVHALALECPEAMGTIGTVICKFSQDGSVLGVCRPYAERMRVWNLEHGLHYSLVREGNSKKLSREFHSQQLLYTTALETTPRDESIYPCTSKWNQFCQFALSQSGERIVTCMADLTLLLWNLSGDKFVLSDTHLPVLKSKYFPAWAVCFSVDKDGSDTIVVCEDTGVLFWVDIKSGEALARKTGGGRERCQFSADGSRGVLVETSQSIHIWDLIERRRLRQVNYKVPVGLTGVLPFGHNVFMSGDRSFAGLPNGVDSLAYGEQGVMCFPDTTDKDLMSVGKVARSVVVTEKPDWIIVDKFMNAEFRILSQATQQPSEIQSKPKEEENAEHATQYPEAIDYHDSEKWKYIWSSEGRSLDSVEELTILNVDGRGTVKMLDGEELLAKQSLSVSSDGRRVACMMENGKVMVWSPFAARGSIPDYNDLVVLKGTPEKEVVLQLLESHGPSALNMPDWTGKTVPFHVINNGDHEIFKILANWAVESGTKMAMNYWSTTHKKNHDHSHGVTTMLDVAVNLRQAIAVEVGVNIWCCKIPCHLLHVPCNSKCAHFGCQLNTAQNSTGCLYIENECILF